MSAAIDSDVVKAEGYSTARSRRTPTENEIVGIARGYEHEGFDTLDLKEARALLKELAA